MSVLLVEREITAWMMSTNVHLHRARYRKPVKRKRAGMASMNGLACVLTGLSTWTHTNPSIPSIQSLSRVVRFRDSKN